MNHKFHVPELRSKGAFKKLKSRTSDSPSKLMPTYYFHIRDNGVLIKDSIGVEVDDLSAARDQCRQLILSVLREEQSDEELSANRQFRVEDERSRTVLIVPFRLALSLVRPGAR